jgi:ubiquinone/menaquinone biosynthesis C-methylase UbiE
MSAYQSFISINEELLKRYDRYNQTLQERGYQFHRMFKCRLERYLVSPHLGTVLDIGCGTGAGTVVLAAESRHVVGLDIHLPSLIVAKKHIESQGLSNVTLVRGSALRMPFSSETFDYAMAINVLEHIFEPSAMLSEVLRVLTAGGVFGGDSRNRFDLFFPEPHVKLRLVGFLPRSWMAPYVRWRRGVSYNNTWLLSYGDLQHALRAVLDHEWHIVMPDVRAYGFPEWVGWLGEWVDRIGLLRSLFIRLSPTHLVLVRRPCQSAGARRSGDAL